MKTHALRAIALAFAAACATAPATATEDGDLPAAAQPPAPAPQEIEADPAAAWTRFLSSAALEDVYAAHAVLNDVGYQAGTVDADRCRDHAQALRASVERAPVGLAMRHAAMLCAEAIGDDAWAEEEATVFVALSRHALSGAGATRMGMPVRVLMPRDPYALLKASGLDFLYEYYQDARPARYFPLVVAALDPDSGKERLLRFDFVDSGNAMLHGDVHSGFPAQRHALANEFLRSHAEGGDVASIDALALVEAASARGNQAKRDPLKRAAERGGIQSARAWAVLCVRTPFEGCGDGLFEALLPGAESRHGAALVLMAFAHAEGIGSPASEDDAKRLLDLAATRWEGEGTAEVEFSELWSLSRGDDLRPGWLLDRLERAASAGSIDARLHLLALRADEAGLFGPEATRFLSQPGINSLGEGHALLAADAFQAKAKPLALGFMGHAAAAGNAMMMGLAVLSELEAVKGTPTPALLERLEAAAHAGSAAAARRRASIAADAGQWQDAQSWLLAPAWSGDADAILDYALLISEDHPGAPAKLEEAVGILKALAELDDVPAARRELSRLAFEGRGMPRDPAQARAWLLEDAEGGDAQSQALLGLSYLDDTHGAPDVDAAERWLVPLVEAGNDTAIIDYGAWLYYKGESVEARLRGLDVWAKGEAHDILTARNNHAWALCTSPDAAILDPERGLEIALAMDADHELDAGETDTVAACHAATGDFESATRVQQAALDAMAAFEQVPGDQARADAIEAMRENLGSRLALYRAREAYVEPIPQ